LLTGIVKDYVYPEIANELLRWDGDLVYDRTTINTEHLDDELITPKTDISKTPDFSSGSNVILGLFNSLEGNA
jgi:hypothetical protein